MAGALFTVDCDLWEIKFINIKRLIRMELSSRRNDGRRETKTLVISGYIPVGNLPKPDSFY